MHSFGIIELHELFKIDPYAGDYRLSVFRRYLFWMKTGMAIREGATTV